MPDKPICPKCSDAKHVLYKGNWIRCVCLNTAMLNSKYANAGITYPVSELSFKNLKTKFPFVTLNKDSVDTLITANDLITDKKRVNFPMCLQGSSSGPKDLLAQLLLKSFIDTGISAKQFSMEDLISLQFKDSLNLEGEFNEVGVFSLYFGSEIQNNVGSSFLQELIRFSTISKTYLLLSTSLNMDGIRSRYGESVGKLFVSTSQIIRGEKRVVFLPLEK